MSKANRFAVTLKNIVKSIAIFMLQMVKFIVATLPELVKSIKERLRFSITFKTTVTYTLLFTTLLLMLGTALISGFSFFLIHRANQSLEQNSQMIKVIIENSSKLPEAELEQYATIENISLTLYDQHATTIFETTAKEIPYPLPIRLSPSSLQFDQLRISASPLSLPSGPGLMDITKSISEEMAYLFTLMTILGLCCLMAIFITIIIGSRTSRKMLRPIDNMTRTAQSISAGALDTRLDVVDSHDELKELAVTFNNMLDRLQTSFEQQNTFVSDASHELKTPIAVIQGYANLLQRWGKEDQAILQESLDAIKSEADYMQELLDKLLLLASTDKKQYQPATAEFSLHELIAEVLKETRLIDSRHHILGERNESITIKGDRGLIKQALRVFLDNSLKYTPEGGEIKLNSIRNGSRALITIADTGVGIAADDLPFIFNRFYKADKSRSREKGGVGLGLAIAKWIIEEHQGKIKVLSTPTQGTEVLISLPALPG